MPDACPQPAPPAAEPVLNPYAVSDATLPSPHRPLAGFFFGVFTSRHLIVTLKTRAIPTALAIEILTILILGSLPFTLPSMTLPHRGHRWSLGRSTPLQSLPLDLRPLLLIVACRAFQHLW